MNKKWNENRFPYLIHLFVRQHGFVENKAFKLSVFIPQELVFT